MLVSLARPHSSRTSIRARSAGWPARRVGRGPPARAEAWASRSGCTDRAGRPRRPVPPSPRASTSEATAASGLAGASIRAPATHRQFRRKKDAEHFLNAVRATWRKASTPTPTGGRTLFQDCAQMWRAGPLHWASTAAQLETYRRVHADPTLGRRSAGSIAPHRHSGLAERAIPGIGAWVLSSLLTDGWRRSLGIGAGDTARPRTSPTHRRRARRARLGRSGHRELAPARTPRWRQGRLTPRLHIRPSVRVENSAVGTDPGVPFPVHRTGIPAWKEES